MAFCRLDGSRTERKEKERPSPVHTGNSQILKRPRERAAELSCRVQCTGAGAFLPDTREERAGPSREKGRQRKSERNKKKREREREEKRTRAAMLFLFTHPLYQHSESRLPKVYDATREREDVSRSSRSAASAPREVSEVRASDASAFRY